MQEEVAHAQNTLLLEQRKANKQLGLFSSHGIEEAKSRFWYYLPSLHFHATHSVFDQVSGRAILATVGSQ